MATPHLAWGATDSPWHPPWLRWGGGCSGKALALLEGERELCSCLLSASGGWPATSQGLVISGADRRCGVGMFALPLLFPMALSCLCSGGGGGRPLARGHGWERSLCAHHKPSCCPNVGEQGHFIWPGQATLCLPVKWGVMRCPVPAG